jgi:hypothetical protein
MGIETKLGVVDMRIVKFEARVIAKEGEAPRFEDWVHLCPPGSSDRSVLTKRVSQILKVPRDREVMYAIRQIVEPAYEAWKQGHSLPETGTPLGAWPAITPDQAEAFRIIGIRTVEEVKGMSEREMVRLAIPGARNFPEMAARYLDSLDKTSTAKRLKKKDEEVADLKAKNEEMAQQLAELMALVKGQPSEAQEGIAA